MKSKKLISKNKNEEIARAVEKSIGDSLHGPIGVSVNLTKSKIPIPDYVMLFQAVTLLLVKDLKASELMVFVYFLGKVQYSNHIGVDQKTASIELKMPLPTIKKAIQRLQAKNIIIRYADPQDNRRNVYIINPNTAWRGKAKERIKSMRSINKNQLVLPFFSDLLEK